MAGTTGSGVCSGAMQSPQCVLARGGQRNTGPTPASRRPCRPSSSAEPPPLPAPAARPPQVPVHAHRTHRAQAAFRPARVVHMSDALQFDSHTPIAPDRTPRQADTRRPTASIRPAVSRQVAVRFPPSPGHQPVRRPPRFGKAEASNPGRSCLSRTQQVSVVGGPPPRRRTPKRRRTRTPPCQSDPGESTLRYPIPPPVGHTRQVPPHRLGLICERARNSLRTPGGRRQEASGDLPTASFRKPATASGRGPLSAPGNDSPAAEVP